MKKQKGKEKMITTQDLTLVPFLRLKGVDVNPVRNDRRRIEFEIPEDAAELIREFYDGAPVVELPKYVAELKRVRALVYSMRD